MRTILSDVCLEYIQSLLSYVEALKQRWKTICSYEIRASWHVCIIRLFCWLHSPNWAFSHLLTRLHLFHGCRSIWRLCRSSSQRWPSGTRVSPAPARVRTDSPEVWEPSASWTTDLQRPAWTDRRGRTDLLLRDTVGAEMTATLNQLQERKSQVNVVTAVRKHAEAMLYHQKC